MKTNPLDMLPKVLELAAANLLRSGTVPMAVYLWVMKHPSTGETKDEPGVLVPPGPTTSDVDGWFRSVEQQAIDLDAIAAILVTELSRPGERYLVLQYERRGEATRLWKARITARRGALHLGDAKPDTRGVSTMTVLPSDPSRRN